MDRIEAVLPGYALFWPQPYSISVVALTDHPPKKVGERQELVVRLRRSLYVVDAQDLMILPPEKMRHLSHTMGQA